MRIFELMIRITYAVYLKIKKNATLNQGMIIRIHGRTDTGSWFKYDDSCVTPVTSPADRYQSRTHTTQTRAHTLVKH